MEQIDIILATYNGEKYLKEQLDSILNQTYTNFRLLISDDCSQDSTKEILKEYEKKDNRIKVFFQEKNLGYVKNFEFLLTKVESSIYALSDQDDIWNKYKVEKSYNKLKEENADLVFTDLEMIDEEGKTIKDSFNDYMKLSRKIEKTLNSYELAYLYNCITGCTILAKTEMLKKILPIPKTSKHMIHDYWIAVITAVNGKVTYLKEPTIKYRQHRKNQIGANHTVYKFDKFEQVRNHLIDVKLGVFGVYVENKEKFPKELQEQNEKAYKYFKSLQQTKNINFRNLKIFKKLYKNETFKYQLENFMVLNMPALSRVIYNLKIKGKEK